MSITVIYIDAETDRSYTFSELKATALSFGHGLKALWDWRKGDVLALYTPNCIDTPPIMWGMRSSEVDSWARLANDM